MRREFVIESLRENPVQGVGQRGRHGRAQRQRTLQALELLRRFQLIRRVEHAGLRGLHAICFPQRALHLIAQAGALVFEQHAGLGPLHGRKVRAVLLEPLIVSQ